MIDPSEPRPDASPGTPPSSIKAPTFPGSEDSETLPPPADRLSDDPAALTPGESCFDLIRQIARGGEGEIWEAEQISLGRIVALKVVRRSDEDSPSTDPESSQSAHRARQLCREARMTAVLEHPHIVPIHDLAVDAAGKPMIAMKRVQGASWAALLAEDWASLSPEDYLDKHLGILSDVAQAVAFAHSRGILHRDIKPSQVMIGEFGEVLLMDWGLSVSVDPSQLPERWRPRQTPMAPNIAQARNPCGTPAFMAPEQTLESIAEIGPWTDVYLLGASLYYMLSGTPPHPGSTHQEIMWWAAANKYAPIVEAVAGRPLPDGLAELLGDTLDAIGSSRPTALEFLGRLRDIRSGHPRRRRSAAILEAVDARLGGREAYSGYAALHQQIQEARILWPSNPQLAAVQQRLSAEHAEMALSAGDLALAGMLAEGIGDDAQRSDLAARTDRARARRTRRESQRRAAFAAVLVLFALSSVAAIVAITEKRRADQQLVETERAKDLADSSATLAEAARARAELEQCYASTAIADAYFRDSRPDLAYTTLVDRIPVHMRQWEWGALVARLAVDDMTLITGEVAVGSAVFHADWAKDGSIVATAHHGGRIAIWDAASGRRLREWKFDGIKGFWCVRFDRDAARIAASSTNGKVLVVDARTGDVIARGEMAKSTHQSVMRGCDFSPDGKLVATTGEDQKLHFWDAASGALVRSVQLPDSTYDARFSPDGRTVAVAALNDAGQAHLVSAETGEILVGFAGHGRSVLSVRFDEAGERLLTACNDGAVRIFSVSDGKLLREFTVPEARMRCAEFDSTGRLVAASGNDGTCRVWDADSGELLHRINGAKQMEKVAFEPGSQRLLTVSFDEVRLWSLQRLGPAALADSAQGEVDGHLRLPSFPYARQDVWVGYDEFYLPGTGRRIYEKEGNRFAVDSFYSVFSPDERWRIAIGFHDAKARAIAASGEESDGTLLAERVYTAAFSPDSRLAAVGMRLGDLLVLEAGTWKEVAKWIHPDEKRLAISALCFSPDSRTLAIGWQTGQVATFDVRSCQTIHDIADAHKPGKPVVSISFSADGRKFVSASSDETARVWSVASGDPVCTLAGHALNVLSAEFSPDGERILTASMDNKGKIWDARTGREIVNAVALPPGESMMGGGFSDDGTRAFFATAEGRVHVVDCLPWQPGAWDCGTGNRFLRCLELHKRREHLNPQATIDDIAWN